MLSLRKILSTQTLYGHGDRANPYMFRVMFLWRFRYHVFYRGDIDPEPHDHPFWFVTFPLIPYVEEVYDPDTAQRFRRVVGAFRFHYRPAHFAHRVIGRWDELAEFDPDDGNRPLRYYEGNGLRLIAREGKVRTLVFHGPKARSWGFWCKRIWTP